MKKYNLYVLLTKTPFKTGKFIRKMTNFEYNHVSITLDKNLNTLHSFARKYKNATFFSGLVTESSLRYTEDNKKTKVMVYKIPLNPKKYIKIKKYLDYLSKHKNDYLYNFYSALVYPLHKKVRIKKAYTCCEFAVHILRDYCKLDLGQKEYCSIKELSVYLKDYKVYEGIFKTENASWECDPYLQKQNIFYKYYKVMGIYGRLTLRFFKGLIIRKWVINNIW